MSDAECWDIDDEPTNKGNESEDLEDDWDISDSEIEARKAKAKQEEEERKAKQKSMKQKIKEKEEKEKAAKAARIAELNRVKTEAQKQAEQEKAAEDIINDQLGDLDDLAADFDDDNTAEIRELAAASAPKTINIEKTLDNFGQPKTKQDMDKLSDLLVEKMYEFKDNKLFNYLLEQTSYKMGDRQEIDNYESVKLMGSKLSSCGNNKQNAFKAKNKKKKPGKSKGIQLGRGGKVTENLDEFDDFDDDFM